MYKAKKKDFYNFIKLRKFKYYNNPSKVDITKIDDWKLLNIKYYIFLWIL